MAQPSFDMHVGFFDVQAAEGQVVKSFEGDET